MTWEAVWYFGEGINDYDNRYFRTKEDAEDFLTRKGYAYSTTHGKEDVYYDENGMIASIMPVED